MQITFASNHYGRLYLTELLLPIMKKSQPAAGISKRIVWVTSIGSQLVNPPVLKYDLIPWDDLKCAAPQGLMTSLSALHGDVACRAVPGLAHTAVLHPIAALHSSTALSS
jgi:NAD(P)-dependent dehydrogenase (short-subunit alcohol dehydrogenase family)